VRQIASAPDRRRWLALALLGTAFFMVILDGTIVYVALPAIADELGFSAGGVQRVTSAYLLCFGALLLLGGRTADLLGRRRLFMVGVGLFVSSSTPRVYGVPRKSGPALFLQNRADRPMSGIRTARA
jgi:MFS family permease